MNGRSPISPAELLVLPEEEPRGRHRRRHDDPPAPPRRKVKPSASAGATPPPPVKPPPPRTTQRDRRTAWLALPLLLLLAVVPLLLEVQRPAVTGAREAATLSRAIVLSGAEDPFAPPSQRVTHEGLRPPLPPPPLLLAPPPAELAAVVGPGRLDPLTTPQGAYLLQAWVFGLDPVPATLGGVVLRGRMVSVAASLVTVAAVLWIGFSIGGLTTAVLATLVFIAFPAFLLFGRLATPDAPLLAAITLGHAGALWATRPLRPSPSLVRQAGGWVLCGLCLGAAIHLAGLPAVVPMLLPLLVIVLICPRRVGHLLGLLACTVVAGLTLVPWVMRLTAENPEAWQAVLRTLQPEASGEPLDLYRAVGTRAGLLAVVLLPWSPWLLAALVQPFSTSTGGARNRMFIGWSWFVTLALVVLLAPGGVMVSPLLLMVPVAAILLGQLFRQYVELSAEGRHARFWRLSRWPMLVLLLGVSVAVPLGLGLQPGLTQRGYVAGPLAQPVTAGMPLYFWLGLGTVLLVITGVGARFAIDNYPGKAVACWSIWTVVLVSVLAIPLARGPLARTDPADVLPVRVRAVDAKPPLDSLAAEALRLAELTDE